MIKYFETKHNRKIAYKQVKFGKDRQPGVFFFCGYGSDMEGTKSQHLLEFCKANQIDYTCFDYSGHGASSGRFLDFTLGDWLEDTKEIFRHLIGKPQILIGSSMGGGIMIHIALAFPNYVDSLIGIAAAPDFTENLMWVSFSKEQKLLLLTKGKIDATDSFPFDITRELIEEGRNHLIMNAPININKKVTLLHGLDDTEVPYSYSIKLANIITSDNISVRLYKGGNHRLSEQHHLEEYENLIIERIDG